MVPQKNSSGPLVLGDNLSPRRDVHSAMTLFYICEDSMRILNLLVLVCAFAVMALTLRAESLSTCDSVAGNLVANCGFETGDFTGWTTGGNFEDSEIVTGTYYAYSGANSGTYYAALGPNGSDATLSQTLSTGAGTDYTLAFYLASIGDEFTDFSAYWNGTQLLSLTDPNSETVYTLYTYSVTGTGTDTIQFDFRDDPGFTALDDISVASDASPVPEPGTFSLLFLGLGLGIAFMGRQRLLA